MFQTIFTLQTHSKVSKKAQPSHLESTTSDEMIHAVIEPPPYGTSHVVGKLLVLFIYL